MTPKQYIAHVDAVREAISKLERLRLELHPVEVENRYSPPYQGFKQRNNTYVYPPQLVGYRSDRNKERVRISGSTNGQSQFGGISGSVYGNPTGGSYAT